MKTRADSARFNEDVRIGEDVLRQAALSDRLREMFAEVLNEPVPADLLGLVAHIPQDEAPQ